MAEGREFGLVHFSRTSRPMVRTMEKSRARRTINDAPLPKVNWYLPHICFPLFKIFFAPYLFFSTACLKFSKLFSACWNFSSTFFLKQKYQNIFLSFEIFWKMNLNIFSSKLWPCTKFSKYLTVKEMPGQRGDPAGPPWGRPTPQVSRP